MIKYAYGITTVDSREYALFKASVDSLTNAGFYDPVVFVDDKERGSRLGAFGNWVRAAWELYIRSPGADRYIIFQDDIEAVSNLKQILDGTEIKKNQYLNLYSTKENDRYPESTGWNEVSGMGKGALGLCFTNEGLRDLLSHPEFVNHPLDRNGKEDIDGTISFCLKSLDYVELSHSPSLIKHTGVQSTIGHIHSTDEPLVEIKKTSPIPRTIREDRGPKIGFVGSNVLSGFGEKSRQITTYLPIAHWLIKPHRAYTESSYDLTPIKHTILLEDNKKELKKFISDVDIVLFDESPLYTSLIPLCKELGKRVVCIPAMEWLPESPNWVDNVDLFICPTKQCYNLIYDRFPCIYFPWPIDVERFRFNPRTKCKRFLYLHGQGGWNDRKGAKVILDALKIWPEFPLIIRSQKPDMWLRHVTEIYGEVEENYDLYTLGDVLVSPHSVDGTGLEHMEAMSCGLPVITTCGEPWNESPAIGRIDAGVIKAQVGRVVDWYKPDPLHLVKLCQEWLGQDISVESKLSRKWAESRSFDKYAEQLEWLVRYGSV